jgi:hypothetical protein
MDENVGVSEFVLIETLYVILIDRGHTRVRLGWVSVSTGLTYCGICLRAVVTPETGKCCQACGATVAHVFKIGPDAGALRNALRRLSRQMTGWAERNIS